MMIRRTTAFDRAYHKLSINHRHQVENALRIFIANPFDVRLRNHKLSGSKEGIRSVRAGYDLRILYIAIDEHAVVILITVGTHDQVY